MAGYANHIIRIDFPDLSEPGDLVHVVIRNPKTMPAAELMPKSLPKSEGGEDEDPMANLRAMYPILARMVRAWHVYDGTVDDEDLPLLPLPATEESIAKLPFPILTKLGEVITEVVAPS